MITLTETREITPYLWVHPDDDDQHQSRRAAVNGWNAFRSSPHPSHAGADIDAHALSSRARGSAGRNRPTCLVKQAEKAIWDKTRPRGIEMAIAWALWP
jgi:hypothetical protein